MKTFVEFYFPGTSLSGKNEREVTSRNEAVTLPPYAISYRFFDKDEAGNKSNFSPYYYVGKEYSIAEFLLKYPQLKGDEYFKNIDRILLSPGGDFYSLPAAAVVISA